jgi:4-amino-4-deoxychorismate lyase
MSVRVFVGADEVGAVQASDRGLAYGDGLFETMRACRGGVPWFARHWARLAAGAERLGLSLPEREQVDAVAADLLRDGGDGVLKLLVSRGAGGRGYAPPPEPAQPAWLLARHPLPAPARRDGLHLRWCRTRLAVQPRLAGIKHCNRLEQVLARAEWRDAAWDEGLVLDSDGRVVSAISANLLVFREGRWRTPRVDRCGVAGVCRGWLLETGQAEEAEVPVEHVETADALALCNAVRGILPVARLGDRAWPAHPAVRGLQRRLAADHPGFAEFANPEDHA